MNNSSIHVNVSSSNMNHEVAKHWNRGVVYLSRDP